MYVLVSGRAEESTSHQRPHLDGRDVSRQPATESRTFVWAAAEPRTTRSQGDRPSDGQLRLPGPQECPQQQWIIHWSTRHEIGRFVAVALPAFGAKEAQNSA